MKMIVFGFGGKTTVIWYELSERKRKDQIGEDHKLVGLLEIDHVCECVCVCLECFSRNKTKQTVNGKMLKFVELIKQTKYIKNER